MARARKVEIVIGGDASGAARAFGTAGASARRFEGQVKASSAMTTAAFRAMRIGAIGLGAAIAGAAIIGTKQLMAEDAAMKAVANTIRSTGGAANVTADAINKFAVSLQRQTGYGDDALIGMQNILLTFRNIRNEGTEKIFDRTAQATADLARQFNKDLPSAAIMVGKALNDPTIGLTAMSRAGITFSKAQKEVIIGLAESGQMAKAQTLILEELEKQVGGAAAAFGKSIPGQIEIARREFEDMTQVVAEALLPAFMEMMPVIRQTVTAIGPVLASLGKAFAEVVNTLINDEGVRAFASAITDGLTTALTGLADIAKTVAQALGPLLGAIASVGRTVLGSSVGMAALTAALGAFIALKAVAYVQALAAAFMRLAVVQTLGPGVAMLAGSMRTLTMGFSGVSAASMGLAPGLTAAGAGISRFAVAGNAARTGLATLGRGMLSLVGGPVGAMTVAAGALAFTIGDDLVRSFFGGQSAADQYRIAQDAAKLATDGLRSSTQQLVGALAGVAQAETAETAAKQAAVAATRAKQQALAQYGSGSAQYRAAVANERRANVDLVSAMSNTDAARDRSEQSTREQIKSLIGTGDAIRDLATKSRAGLGTVPPLVDRSSKAWQQYQVTVAAADARFMRTNKTVQEQQRTASRLAGELKLLGPEYSAAAQAANRLANAKTPTAYSKALGEVTKALGGTTKEADAAAGKVNNKVGQMGAVPTQMGQVETQVGLALDRIIANVDAKVAQANEKLRKIGDRSSPVVATTVANNLKAVGAVMEGELENITTIAGNGAKQANNALRRGLSFSDAIASATTTLGAAPMESGLRDVISQARSQGISVGAENDATAAALAREVGQTQRLMDATKRLTEARRALSQENSKGNQQAVRKALADVREAAATAGVTTKVKSAKQAKAALTAQTKQMAATQAVARMRAQALQEQMRQQEIAAQAAQAAFAKYREQVMQATDAKYNDAFQRVGETITLIPGKFTALNRELQASLKVIEDTRAALTPAEQALKDFEDATASSDLAAKLSDAQAQLAKVQSEGQAKLSEAQRLGDPKLIAEAQSELETAVAEAERQVAAAERDTRIAELRATAETERAERDRIAADAVTAEQDRFEARRLELEAQREQERKAAEDNLAVLEAQLNRVPAILAGAKAPAEDELTSIVRTFGRFGDRAGDNYIRYLRRSLGDIDNVLARTIATKVEPYLRLRSPAKKGPLSKLDKWFVPFTDTLMGGVDTAMLARSSSAIAGATMPGGKGAVGGTTVVVNVDGNQFDAREFARRLEPELARIVSANF